MIKPETEAILRVYGEKSSAVAAVKTQLYQCVELLTECFKHGGRLLICGNGGSCADADHIAGELVKAFRLKRPLPEPLAAALQKQGSQGMLLKECLQGGLAAINLGAQAALVTAVVNDMGGEYIFAQQVVAYGRSDDVLLGISTSGNSLDVLYAGLVARAMGMKTLALTGHSGGKLKDVFDLVVCAPAETTEDIQDMHSVFYHAVCAAVECQFWGG